MTRKQSKWKQTEYYYNNKSRFSKSIIILSTNKSNPTVSPLEQVSLIR